MLLQSRSPAPHLQAPAWQVRPLPQTLPQAPQFCVVVTSVQTPPQLIWPVAQVVSAVDGVAQLATKSARPKQAASADKKVLRTIMVRLLLLGGVSSYPSRYRGVSYSSPAGIIPRIIGQPNFWRCRPDLNRGMKVLQTFALPLGHGTERRRF